jgi:uncharacterized protein YjbI with pentapeptide repeats
MANQEQLKILLKGADKWNSWWADQEVTTVVLWGSKADLSGSDLKKVDLRNVGLGGADLSGADLSAVDLSDADLRQADLTRANLSKANLSRANLSESKLNYANLSQTILNQTNLNQANFQKTIFGTTTIGGIDLSKVYGIENATHRAPSPISTDTIQLSKGRIPEVFLQGCGLTDWEIESAKLYDPKLTNEKLISIQYRIYDLRATQSIQISPLFISYSHSDKKFVDKLEKSLIAKGIRFWRDIHDMRAGRIETQIDRAIRQNPTVLLVLSKNSMNSDWVQHEVRKARELEKELGRDAMCPIALDDSWKSSRWPQRVMDQVMEYNILDFSKWEDEATFQAKFAKLLSGLEIFYKKPEK